jgi:hypothetical protein
MAEELEATIWLLERWEADTLHWVLQELRRYFFNVRVDCEIK